MKILHYIDNFYPAIGGGEFYVDNIIKNLPSFEFEVLTNFIESELREEKYSNNSTIHRIPPGNSTYESSSRINRSLTYVANTIKSYVRLKNKKEHLRKHKYDLIHFHGEGINIEFRTFDKIIKTPLLSFLPDFNFLPAKKILTLHSFISYFTNHPVDLWWEKRIISMFENIICVDSFVYKNVKKIAEKTGESKNIHLLPNSVDRGKFKFLPLKNNSRLKVLFVGRLTPEKGLNLICDFIKNMPGFVDLVLVGAGSAQVSEDIRKCPNFDKVSFFENVHNDKIAKFYQDSDIVLNFVKVPGLPRSTLEAMSCGRPVVMLNMGDRAPVIDGETGFLINEDLGELIDLLERVNKGRKKLNDISLQATKVVELQYSNDIILKKMEAIYSSLG